MSWVATTAPDGPANVGEARSKAVPITLVRTVDRTGRTRKSVQRSLVGGNVVAGTTGLNQRMELAGRR